MSQEAELFILLDNREYPAALDLLKTNPKLDINALNERGGSFFMEAVMKESKSPERYELIEILLSNPDFQHANQPYQDSTSTPFRLAVANHEPDIIELILKHKDSKNIDALFHNPLKLMYVEHAQRLARYKKSAEQQSGLARQAIEATFPDRQKVLDILLQLTVHHAIETDDTSLLQRLVDAGAKLYYPLKDGTYPIDLVKDKQNLSVHQWLSEYIKEQITSNPTLSLAAQNLARKHEQSAQEVVSKQIDTLTASIQSIFKFFDYKVPETKPSEEKPKQDNSPTGF